MEVIRRNSKKILTNEGYDFRKHNLRESKGKVNIYNNKLFDCLRSMETGIGGSDKKTKCLLLCFYLVFRI